MPAYRLAFALFLLSPLPATPALAQSPGFTRIGEIAEYRIEGVRRGIHQGVSVRFLDMSLRNLSTNTTFPGTMQEIWWQGRQSGAEVKPLHRDGSRFGMYDFVKPGELVAVTYPVPDREEIGGITIEFPHAPGMQKRALNWAELGDAAGPDTPAAEAPNPPEAATARPSPGKLAEQAQAAFSAIEPAAEQIRPIRRLKARIGKFSQFLPTR
jgi:hypothetical protein